MWEKLFANRAFTHIGVLVLAIGAFLLYLRIIPRGPAVYVPGPTSVQTVYEPKWKDRIKPVPYLVPVGAKIEYFPKAELAKASKIPDAPDNAIAFGQVPPHGGKTTVFATLKPGVDNVMRGGLEYRQEALPFWQLKRELHGGIYYGIAGRNMIEGQVRLNFLRTGPATWNGQARAGIEKEGEMNGALLVGVEF